jgi:hypothetical protein
MPLLETRGAASARGFGFGGGAKRIVDWTPYILVPNTPNTNPFTNANPTRISFINTDTSTLDFNVSVGGQGYGPPAKLMRVGDWLYWWVNISTGNIFYYNIITGAYAGILNLTPAGVGGCDVAKIGNENNPLLPSKVVSMNRTENGTLVVARWTHNNDTGAFTLDTTASFSGVFTSSNQTGSSYSTPQIAPMGNMSNGVWTYAGVIGYVGFDDYPGPTYTRWLLVNVPYSGAISTLTSNQTSDNFSRPAAGTLDGNRALLATLDNGTMRVANTGGSFTDIFSRNNNAYNNGYAPAAITGGGARIALTVQYDFDGTDYFRNLWLLFGNGSASTLVSSQYTFGYQTQPNAVLQQGTNSTTACWYTTAGPFSGTNYVYIASVNSSGILAYFTTNYAPLLNCLIDGNRSTSRIVSYGA